MLKNRKLRAFHLLLLFFFTQLAFSQKSLEPYWPKMPKFELPLGLVKAPGLPNWIFVVQQRGKVYRVEDKAGASKRTLLLDLSKLVSQQNNETGLLGLAFHPDFQKNGKFYVSYTKGEDGKMISCISEGKVENPARPMLMKSKLSILITVSQPYTNHNGGAICFGPDGYLYFSWGDGGAGGDPKNNAQNIHSLLGKIHRIDVNRKDPGKAYSIPKDNPFLNRKGARPEIYALGVRNVWKMHFDPESGKLWAGDVGQNKIEEIDIIEKGKNYGWRIKEANADFDEKPTLPLPVLEPPVFSYSQSNGDRSITGGLIYHGSITSLKGSYIYGDYESGRIWAFEPKYKTNLFLVEGDAVSCFGENSKKEILVADHREGVVMVLK